MLVRAPYWESSSPSRTGRLPLLDLGEIRVGAGVGLLFDRGVVVLVMVEAVVGVWGLKDGN
jgi:hypothetical protein